MNTKYQLIKIAHLYFSFKIDSNNKKNKKIKRLNIKNKYFILSTLAHNFLLQLNFNSSILIALVVELVEPTKCQQISNINQDNK